MAPFRASRFCPVCQIEKTVLLREIYREYRLWQCRECGLVFADPLVYCEESYQEAYGKAESSLRPMAGYSRHLGYAEQLIGVADVYPFLIPLEREVIRRLRGMLPAGTAILDLGCGTGRLLIALRQMGFNAFGLDVAEDPVRVLSGSGFPVLRGTIYNYPSAWPHPEAIVCLEVMEHLADPIAFLFSIRRRFPKAKLLLAVPAFASRRRFDRAFREADYPPNHLTRWGTKALQKALRQSGYQGSVSIVHTTGDHLPMPWNAALERARGIFSRALAAPKQSLTKTGNHKGPEREQKPLDHVLKERVRRMKRIALSPYVLFLRLIGGSGYWLLAEAETKEQ